MKGAFRLLGMALLSAGCMTVQKLPMSAPGGQEADTPMGWARLADHRADLDGDRSIRDYLRCADTGEATGDLGAAVLCLEAAFRLSFQGGARWDQEAQRAKLARRLESIKAGQGRIGAAAGYAAMAALSEAYEDSGQADDERRVVAQAEAQLAEARRRKSEAEAAAMGNFLGSSIGSLMDVATGTVSSDIGMLQQLQHTMDYAKADSAIAASSQGLAESEQALRRGTARQAEDRASRLLAAYLAGTDDPAPYARAVQKAVRARVGERASGAVGAFLSAPLPDRARSSKKDFVQAFQAAEKELWAGDLRRPSLALAALKYEQTVGGGEWDRPRDYMRQAFFAEAYSEGGYNRTLEMKNSTTNSKKLTFTVNLAPAVGFGFSIEGQPYPGSGLYVNNGLYLVNASLGAPKPSSATGSAFSIVDRVGFGVVIGSPKGGLAQLALGVNTQLMTITDIDINIGKGGYRQTTFEVGGLELEASLRLLRVIKLGLGLPVLAPLSPDAVRDPGGLRLIGGVNFVFGPGGPKEPEKTDNGAVERAKPKQARTTAASVAARTARGSVEEPASAEASMDGATATKKKAEEEARLKQEAEAEARGKADEAARLKAEAEAKKKAAEEEEARLKAEADAKAEARKKTEEAARLQAEAEARRKAEADLAKQRADLETQRQALALERERSALRKERDALRTEREALAVKKARSARARAADLRLPQGGLGLLWAFHEPSFAKEFNEVYGVPMDLGLAVRWRGLVVDAGVFFTDLAYDPKAPIAGQDQREIAHLTSPWLGLGYDVQPWKAGLGQARPYLPLGLRFSAQYVAMPTENYFAPTLSAYLGLGLRWRLSPRFGLDFSGRYHLHALGESFDAENGGALQLNGRELKPDTDGPELRLGGDFYLW